MIAIFSASDDVFLNLITFRNMSTLTWLVLYANLDRGGNDPQACNTAGTDCPNVPAQNLCGNNNNACNYGVSSQNVSP